MESRLPQPLDCSALAKEWPGWKQQFYIYMLANNKMDKTEEVKIATFLWLIGKRGMEVYNALFPGMSNNMFEHDSNGAALSASANTAVSTSAVSTSAA